MTGTVNNNCGYSNKTIILGKDVNLSRKRSLLYLYAKASQTLGALGPIIAWPLFMIFIILMSNFWGFSHGEWRGASRRAQAKILCAILLLIIAVIILMFASLYR